METFFKESRTQGTSATKRSRQFLNANRQDVTKSIVTSAR